MNKVKTQFCIILISNYAYLEKKNNFIFLIKHPCSVIEINFKKKIDPYILLK